MPEEMGIRNTIFPWESFTAIFSKTSIRSRERFAQRDKLLTINFFLLWVITIMTMLELSTVCPSLIQITLIYREADIQVHPIMNAIMILFMGRSIFLF